MSHGQTLGRYTLIEQLAIGGMAEIWLAHMAGPEGFEKVVVIKKIRPHLRGQKNFLNMFLNEARLAAHLNHPNIVQIHEFGKPNDQYYIAMEYIFGRDLSEIVPKAKRASIPFPIEYATKIIAQVCEGLYYAHTKADNKGVPLEIIHRDISPQNVLVSFDGHVKILDFGIAKAANQYEQTQQGILKGKVSYMAPEQILGDSTDCRADIFSLGAVFYELLTGYKLFSGDNELAILRSITDGPIYPPSYFNEDIPDELEEIILKALAKDPNERYPSAWEMQRALNQLLIQFDFHPTNTHLANFLKQLFEDEIEQESQYLESKINEVVRGKQAEETSLEQDDILSDSDVHPIDDEDELIHELGDENLHEEEEVFELGPPLHLEGEDEEDPEETAYGRYAQSSSPSVAPVVVTKGNPSQDTEQREVPTQERRSPRKVSYDTRPDIEQPYTLSEDDEIPSFEDEFRSILLDPEADNPRDEELDESMALDADPIDAEREALDSLRHEEQELSTREIPFTPSQLQHETREVYNPTHERVDRDHTPPDLIAPQHYLGIDPEDEAFHDLPDDDPLNQTNQTAAPRAYEDEVDADSVSQILYTMRFRSDDYDYLRELAQRHNMQLEELIHSMLHIARPYFDPDAENEPHQTPAEFDLNTPT